MFIFINHKGDGLRKEVWRDIKGYEGKYKISNTGYVKSLNFNHTRKEKILKNKTNNKGYQYVTLYKNGKQYYPRIHRLVAETFINNPNNLEQVNHIDGNKQNNKTDNLEWCTNLENMHHAIKNKLINNTGEANPRSKKVNQLNFQGEIINTFTSLGEASRYLNKSHRVVGKLLMVCNGKKKSAYGYVWEFAE